MQSLIYTLARVRAAVDLLDKPRSNLIHLTKTMINSADRLATAVERQDSPKVCSILKQIEEEANDIALKQYLSCLHEAVQTNVWDEVKAIFLNSHPIYDQSNVFILAPYSRRVNGQDVVKLTFLQGSVCSYDLVKMETAAISLFGKLNQEIPEFLVIDVETAAGSIGNEESFIAPGGWIL
jgi:hypothetical protein